MNEFLLMFRNAAGSEEPTAEQISQVETQWAGWMGSLAITQAEKLKPGNNHLYHSLPGYLYTGMDKNIAAAHLKTALK